MSTFSGLNTAYTALVAARTGIDIAGQNVANATTEGYTRQRVSQSAIGAPAAAGLFSNPLPGVGQGVSVTSIARLGDSFLESRARTTAGEASFSTVRGSALSSLEKTLNEPSKNGIAAQLGSFWASWQDLSNNVGTEANASVVIKNAGVLVTQIAQGYSEVSTQWKALRANTDVLASELNDAAGQVANLNGLIRSTVASGGNANEFIDQRSVLLTTISSLAGGSITEQADGTVDVLIGGNQLVTGTHAHAVVVTGPHTIEDGAPVQLEWDGRPGASVSLDGGELAGTVSLLAPTTATGSGGDLAEAAASYNRLATSLATTVNDIHRTGVSASGATDLEFFAVAGTGPAALGLSVVPTTGNGIATGATGAGGRDGSIADAISQIASAEGSPDSLWGTMVTTIAVTARSAAQQSTLSALAASSALSAQQSASSVDINEENVNLLMSNTSYNAAARVFTAVDEMLNTLINGTGLVGR
jgi:flagellar hook-associated protein 1 FlgK